MSKYATFDIQICFKYDTIVPDSRLILQTQACQSPLKK